MSILCRFAFFHRLSDSDEEHDLPPIKIGERVIVWLEEGTKVQRGTVESKKSETFCVVDFDDGSVSNDLYPQDIKYCECHASDCNGSHVSGAKVLTVFLPLYFILVYSSFLRELTETANISGTNHACDQPI
jgi:hypothetical protein